MGWPAFVIGGTAGKLLAPVVTGAKYLGGAALGGIAGGLASGLSGAVGQGIHSSMSPNAQPAYATHPTMDFHQYQLRRELQSAPFLDRASHRRIREEGVRSRREQAFALRRMDVADDIRRAFYHMSKQDQQNVLTQLAEMEAADRLDAMSRSFMENAVRGAARFFMGRGEYEPRGPSPYGLGEARPAWLPRD